MPDVEPRSTSTTNVTPNITSQVSELSPYERGLAAQLTTIKQEPKAVTNSNGTRFRNIFYLTLTGILAIVLIFTATIIALSFLSASVAITVVAFAGSVVAVVGTFIGSQTGYLIGSSGKEHAEQRTDNLQSVLLKTISEYVQGSKGISPPTPN